MAYSFPVFLNSASRTYNNQNIHNQSAEDMKTPEGALIQLDGLQWWSILPSQSVLCPERKYICNRPSAALWNQNKRRK